MSESSRQKYKRRLILLAPENEELILTEARRRDPNYDAKPKAQTRILNAIIRDFLDFDHKYYDLFLTWIANRGNSA